MTRRLPIWTTASAAYQHLKKTAGYAALVVSIWTAIMLVAPYWLIDSSGAGVLLLLFLAAIYACGWLVIAVIWHRHFLYPGAPRLTAIQGFFVALAYGLQLFAISSLSGAIFTPPFFLLAATDFAMGDALSEWAKPLTNRDGFVAIGLAFVVLIIPYIFARLSLILPARSLGDDDFGKWTSWKCTSGNGLRLLGAWILAAVPSMMLAILCLEVVSPKNIQGLPMLTIILRTCAAAFIMIAVLNTLSVISIAYAFLVEKRTLPTPRRRAPTGTVMRTQGL